MEIQQCSVCGANMKLVPAGVSKLGKPYQAFYSCQCGNTQRTQQAQPKQAVQPANVAYTNAILQRIEKKVDELTAIVKSIEWIQKPTELDNVNAELSAEELKDIPF